MGISEFLWMHKGLGKAVHKNFATKSLKGEIIYVPDDYSTIQEAIDSLPVLITHDLEIRIGAGTYNENIDLAGHSCLRTLTIKAYDKTNDVNLYDNGTATGGDLGHLYDTTKNWISGIWEGAKIFIYDGKGEGQIRDISGNLDDTIYVTPDWDTIPDTTSKYVILGLVKVNGTLKNYNLNNFKLYGLSFINNASGRHVAALSGITDVIISNCEFLNSSGYGLAFRSGTCDMYKSYFKSSNYGIYWDRNATGIIRHNLIEAETSGSGVGIEIIHDSFAVFGGSYNACVIKNWNIGVRAQRFSYGYSGSLLTYQNCNTNYTPTGSDDSAVT